MAITLSPTVASFIDGVNRLLRINTIITGDDDDITSFSDTQHAADISLAQIAIQDEIGDIVSDRLISYEHTTGSISLATGTRSYALANDFIRFFGTPSFYDSVTNIRLFEYGGGEQVLMLHDYNYKTATGTPMWFYWDHTTTKRVAFYNVPDSNYNGRSMAYDYEGSVIPTNSTDGLPFHNTEEYQAFISMAARRFRFMLENQPLGMLDEDPTYKNAKARLYNLMRPGNPSGRYGKSYV